MIGTVVGSYKITEKIGEGGMGEVFRGIDMMLEREVAIKVLRAEFARQPQLVERFRAEAVTLAKLNHPNIATLHSFFRQGEDFFMVMEFVRGETLDSVIRKRGAMAVAHAVSLFCQALEGIGHAHNLGIVHRDIKPANMMLTEAGSIKVMDFGIARVLGTARMTKQGNIIGTIEYMSPEQVRGQETDARSDIYSLGILLYEMLTGRVPFASESEFELMKAQTEDAPAPPKQFSPHIPLSVEQAIMRALAKKPEARYQTVAEFRFALESGGGVTMPMGAAITAKTPPPTRMGEQAAPQSSAAPKETRLGGEAAPMVAAAGDQLKQTRLGQGGDFAPAYNQPAYNQYAPQHAQASGQPSFLSKLNWMHYSAAGIVLFALVTVPVLLMSFASKQARPAPAAVEQPAPQTAPAQATEQIAPPASGQRSTPAVSTPDAAQPPVLETAPSSTSVSDKAESKPSKPNKKDDAARRAAAEKERKIKEALKLLDQ